MASITLKLHTRRKLQQEKGEGTQEEWQGKETRKHRWYIKEINRVYSSSVVSRQVQNYPIYRIWNPKQARPLEILEVFL